MAIGDLKERLRARFTRRYSSTASLSSADGDSRPQTGRERARSLKSRGSQRPSTTSGGATIDEKDKKSHPDKADAGQVAVVVDTSSPGPLKLESREVGLSDQLNSERHDLHEPSTSPSIASRLLEVDLEDYRHDSSSTADFPTPLTDILTVAEDHEGENEALYDQGKIEIHLSAPSSGSNDAPRQKPPELSRRQSLLPHQQTRLIKTLLETELPQGYRAASVDYFANNGPSTISGNMVSRKIWVKRPGASATLVTIHEDDLVDDVREMILKKYVNSLGRSFDAPDVSLRIVPRDNRQERTLGPEEPMSRTLDGYFPGGQTVDEALIIDVPLRRTPKPSPQPHRGYYDYEGRPAEGGSDYFPPMPVPAAASPRLANILPVGVNGQGNGQHAPLTAHSMSVLTTGHVPALPSPGSTRPRHHSNRPRIGRQPTSSPTLVGSQHQSQLPLTNNGTHDARAPVRSRHQRLLDRCADQPPALLRLRRLQGRTRCLDAGGGLGMHRGQRPLHHHPHAAGTHPDDRPHQDL